MGERLEGRVAIVTGAGRGIGRGVAHLLAQEGASVVVNDIGGSVSGEGVSEGPASEVVQEIREAGGTAVAALDSVAEHDSAARVIRTAINSYGKVDILVHVAGILRDRMVFNMTEEEWDGVLQVHLYGAFNMVRHVVPHMIDQRYGRIVLFSSGSGARRLRAGELRLRQGGDGGLYALPRPRAGAVRHHGQRRLSRGRH